MGKKWWIVGDEDFGPYGPYDVKANADDDRRGIQRTLRHSEEPDFMTTDKGAKK